MEYLRIYQSAMLLLLMHAGIATEAAEPHRTPLLEWPLYHTFSKRKKTVEIKDCLHFISTVISHSKGLYTVGLSASGDYRPSAYRQRPRTRRLSNIFRRSPLVLTLLCQRLRRVDCTVRRRRKSCVGVAGALDGRQRSKDASVAKP